MRSIIPAGSSPLDADMLEDDCERPSELAGRSSVAPNTNELLVCHTAHKINGRIYCTQLACPHTGCRLCSALHAQQREA